MPNMKIFNIVCWLNNIERQILKKLKTTTNKLINKEKSKFRHKIINAKSVTKITESPEVNTHHELLIEASQRLKTYQQIINNK